MAFHPPTKDFQRSFPFIRIVGSPSSSSSSASLVSTRIHTVGHYFTHYHPARCHFGHHSMTLFRHFFPFPSLTVGCRYSDTFVLIQLIVMWTCLSALFFPLFSHSGPAIFHRSRLCNAFQQDISGFYLTLCRTGDFLGVQDSSLNDGVVICDFFLCIFEATGYLHFICFNYSLGYLINIYCLAIDIGLLRRGYTN